MKFKEIRDKIYSNCLVIRCSERIKVATHESTIFDNCEVIGICCRNNFTKNNIDESYIEVIVK